MNASAKTLTTIKAGPINNIGLQNASKIESLLIIEADELNFKVLFKNLASILGSTYRYEHATTCNDALDLIFDGMLINLPLPKLIITDLFSPKQLEVDNEALVIPNIIAGEYPEIPIALFTHLPINEANVYLKRNVKFTGLISKPWTKENNTILQKILSKLI